jgi:hypothetical protein
MSWSYSGNPAASDLDAVRFLIGDVDETDAQLEDEELNFLRSECSDDTQRAAVLACDSLAALYARKTDKAVGPLKVSYSQVMTHYLQLAETLRNRYDTILAAPVNAGPDALLQPPIFGIGFQDNLSAGPQAGG